MLTPTEQQLLQLWQHCQDFIEEQRIGCPETIHQCDWVLENAYDFIEGVANIVGYQNDDT